MIFFNIKKLLYGGFYENYNKNLENNIRKEICEKKKKKKRAIKIKNKESEEYCNGALTQLNIFLGKIKELEKLV